MCANNYLTYRKPHPQIELGNIISAGQAWRGRVTLKFGVFQENHRRCRARGTEVEPLLLFGLNLAVGIVWVIDSGILLVWDLSVFEARDGVGEISCSFLFLVEDGPGLAPGPCHPQDATETRDTTKTRDAVTAISGDGGTRPLGTIDQDFTLRRKEEKKGN